VPSDNEQLKISPLPGISASFSFGAGWGGGGELNRKRPEVITNGKRVGKVASGNIF
jgi:hypothetical protein